MTNVGHTIVGASLGLVCMSPDASRSYKAAHQLTFMLLANLPDLPLRNWGHHRYYFSHSIFVNLALIATIITILGLLPVVRKQPRYPWLIGMGACAWLSHLLLDTFYNHGKGLLMFWPLSKTRLALPIPWFSVMPGPIIPLAWEKVTIFLIEIASYAPFLLLAIWVQKTGRQKRFIHWLEHRF